MQWLSGRPLRIMEMTPAPVRPSENRPGSKEHAA